MEYETKVTEIIKETHDVRTFRMERPPGLKFTAGQYALLELPDEKGLEGETRPFTFSSSPLEEGHIDFTIKEMGEFTKRMSGFAGGEKVIINGPSGEKLKVDETVEEDLAFIAGGSGITPFMSAIRYAKGAEMKNTITLFCANRTEEDIIFRKELAETEDDRFSVVHALSESAGDGWKGEKGRIDKEMIGRHLGSPEKKLWMLCGPPGMMVAMKAVLADIGVPEMNIKEEPWQLPGKHHR